MNRFPSRRRLAAALALVLLLAPAPSAAITVYDPANHAQNLLQAARALEQVQNQVRSLQNQAAMLAGQARNLAPLDYSALETLRADAARVNALLTQASRVARDVEAIRREFARHYAPPAGQPAGGRELVAAAEARWLNSVEALRQTLEVQAGVTASLARTQAEAEALLAGSQDAVGALQAAQSGNQLLALQAKQLADLTALLAAQGRAEALEQARAAAAAAEAKARLERFLAKGGSARP